MEILPAARFRNIAYSFGRLIRLCNILINQISDFFSLSPIHKPLSLNVHPSQHEQQIEEIMSTPPSQMPGSPVKDIDGMTITYIG